MVAAEVLNRSNISIIQDGSWKAVLVTRLTNVMPEAHGYPPLIEAIRELEKTRNAVAECAGYSLGRAVRSSSPHSRGLPMNDNNRRMLAAFVTVARI